MKRETARCEIKKKKPNRNKLRCLLCRESIEFGPYSVEFKINPNMIQECEEYLHDICKIYLYPNELLNIVLSIL